MRPPSKTLKFRIRAVFSSHYRLLIKYDKLRNKSLEKQKWLLDQGRLTDEERGWYAKNLALLDDIRDKVEEALQSGSASSEVNLVIDMFVDHAKQVWKWSEKTVRAASARQFLNPKPNPTSSLPPTNVYNTAVGIVGSLGLPPGQYVFQSHGLAGENKS